MSLFVRAIEDESCSLSNQAPSRFGPHRRRPRAGLIENWRSWVVEIISEKSH